MPSKKKPPKRQHKKPHDKPTSKDKADTIAKLKGMGWHGKDLRTVIHVDRAMAQNLDSFLVTLRHVVKRKPHGKP